jgi:hypothetical protein
MDAIARDLAAALRGPLGIAGLTDQSGLTSANGTDVVKFRPIGTPTNATV